MVRLLYEKKYVVTRTDEVGPYEEEVFRWDGEEFFYNVANHYSDRAFYLVDQNEVIEDGCRLPSLQTMVTRVQTTLNQARRDFPDTPVVILAHSMGCGISTQLDITGVSRLLLITPAGGDVMKLMIDRYGPNIKNGGIIKTSDGLTKQLTKEYVDSVGGIIWEDKYQDLLQRCNKVYTYEAGEDEIVLEDRRAPLRTLPFTKYTIIEGTTHNIHGKALDKLFNEIDNLI